MSNFFTPEFKNESAIASWNTSLEPTPGIIPKLDANRTLTGGVGQEVNIPTLTPNAYDNIILPDASPTLMAKALTTDSNTSLPDSSVDLLTGQAMSEVYEDLSKFAAEPDFVTKMNVAFGENWDAAGAKALAEGWFNRDFSAIPSVKVVSSAEIGGANGAFAAATDTIYLSKEFLTQNGANPAAVADVLLEEIGHSVDWRLNVTDSPGDEGAIFSRVVEGKDLSQGELQALKGEDDSATVLFNGQTITIERATIDYSKTWGGEVFDWSSGFTSKGFYPFTGMDNKDNTAAASSSYSYKNAIYQNWRNGSPGYVGSNKFGVNFWRIADFEKGVTYNFLVKADDYYRIGAIPVNANQANQWVNISRQNWQWLNEAYDGKTYTFTPANTGKYWVYAGYAEAEGNASFALSWDSNKAITVEDTTFPIILSLYKKVDDKIGTAKIGTADSSNIDPNKDTVVVIHGRGGGGDDDNLTIDLAKKAAESQYYPNSQVLYLDWEEAAKDGGQPPYGAAKRIRSVAQWATNRLKELGIDPKKTILLAHSLGSYVASEIGRISGGVKELVALDPASSPGGTYDIDAHNPGTDRAVDFSKAATKSTALVVVDGEGYLTAIAGDNDQAATADNSYLVNFSGYKGRDRITDYHNGVVDVFKDLISRKELRFPSLYTDNRFDNSGKASPQLDRGHEGVISADLSKGDARITGLDYVSNGSNQRTWT